MSLRSVVLGRMSAEARVSTGFSVLLAALPALALLAYKATVAGQLHLTTRLYLAMHALLFAAVVGMALLTTGFLMASGDRRRRFWVPLIATAVVALGGLLLAEAGLRLAARPDLRGMRLGARTLVPYDWSTVADTNRARLARFRGGATSYFAEDSVLGWSVGANRESSDGMYRSSDDGVRTALRAESLRTHSVTQRVALFGDSFTFSMEVPFENSWAHYLAPLLPAGTQVLNFGVDGYGVDQAYLRFKRDAPKWAPRVAVLSLIQDDLYRVVSVYPFLRGWEYSFTRPRFVMEHGQLRQANLPLMTSDSLFAKRSIFDLPLLDHDVFFNPDAWRWHTPYMSYLARFAVTAFPRWPMPNAATDDAAALQISARLLETFVREARAMQIEPVVVYLPSRNDFVVGEPLLKGRLATLLAREGIPLHDMTDCLTRQVARSALFLRDHGHYSAAGNAALARCVQPLVSLHLK